MVPASALTPARALPRGVYSTRSRTRSNERSAERTARHRPSLDLRDGPSVVGRGARGARGRPARVRRCVDGPRGRSALAWSGSRGASRSSPWTRLRRRPRGARSMPWCGGSPRSRRGSPARCSTARACFIAASPARSWGAHGPRSGPGGGRPGRRFDRGLRSHHRDARGAACGRPGAAGLPLLASTARGPAGRPVLIRGPV